MSFTHDLNRESPLRPFSEMLDLSSFTVRDRLSYVGQGQNAKPPPTPALEAAEGPEGMVYSTPLGRELINLMHSTHEETASQERCQIYWSLPLPSEMRK